MFLDRANLPDRGFDPDPPAAAVDEGFGPFSEQAQKNRAAMARLFSATDTALRFRDNFNAESAATVEAYERRNKAIREATGVELDNPLTRRTTGEDWREINEKFGGRRADWLADREAQWRATAAKLAEDRPEHAGRIAATRPIRDDAIAITRGASDELAAAETEAARLPFTARLGITLAGGFRGMARDPVQVASLLLAPEVRGATVAARIVQQAAANAAINAGVEAVVQVKAEEWRRQAGTPIGASGMWTNVGLAAAFGGGFGGLIQGTREAYRAAGRLTPEVAGAIDNLEAGKATAADVEIVAKASGTELTPEQKAAIAAESESALDDAAVLPAELRAGDPYGFAREADNLTRDLEIIAAQRGQAAEIAEAVKRIETGEDEPVLVQPETRDGFVRAPDLVFVDEVRNAIERAGGNLGRLGDDRPEAGRPQLRPEGLDLPEPGTAEAGESARLALDAVAPVETAETLDLLDGLPTGATDADGKPVIVRHADLVAQAERAGELADLVASCKG